MVGSVSIRRYFARSFILTVVLPLLLTGVGIAVWSAWQVQNQSRQALASSAREISGRVANYLDDYRRGVETLAKILERSDGSLDASGTENTIWLDVFREIYPGYITMLVARPDGTVTAAAPWEELEPVVNRGLNVSDRPYFHNAVGTRSSYVSGVFQGRGFGSDPIVAVSAPFAWPSNPRRLGVVEGSLDVGVMRGLIVQEVLKGFEVQVLDPDGRIIATTAQVYSPLARSSWTTRFEPGFARFFDPAWFTIGVSVGGTGWRVLVRQHVSQIYAPLAAFLVAVAFIVGLASLLAAIIYRRASGAISGWLATAAERLENRRVEDMVVPEVLSGSPREIETLAEALHRLVYETQKQQERLENHLADLETTVEERTQELSAQRREFRDFLNYAPALIISVDEQGYLVFTNQYWEAVIGRGADREDPAHIDEFLSSESQKVWWQAAKKVLKSGESTAVRLTIIVERQGELEVSGRLIWQTTADGQVSIRGVFQDISELVDVQRQLRQSQEMLSLFIRNAPAGIAMFDREMRYVSVSKRWLQDYQLEGQQIVGRSYYEVFPETPERWQRIHEKCLNTGISMKKEEDILERSDGTSDWIRWEVIPWRTLKGGVGGLIMLTEVITEQKLLQDQLKVLADYDPLTGLLNRRAFLAHLRRLGNRRSANSPPYGLLFLDLNRFKQINDQYGHAVGDKVLQEIGVRLKAESRVGDVPGRLAGDEFVVLLTEVGEQELPSALARYQEMFTEPVIAANHRFRVSASIGGVIAKRDETVDALLERADKAMYLQKQGDEYDRFDPIERTG